MTEGHSIPPIKWLLAFEAAARHMNFTAAGEELGLTQAAISYQIKSLEAQIGFPLFERRPRHLRLTDMGHAYLPSVRKAFDELSASTAGLFGPLGEGSVTIRVAISFAMFCLAPRLRDFRALYPSINVRIWSSIWANAMPATEADFDIRFGDGKWSGYETIHLTEESAVLVCSAELAKDFNSLDAVTRIQANQIISIAGQDDLWMRIFRETGARPPVGGGCKVDTSLVGAELAESGFGYAVLLKRFAAPFLRDGRLVAPLSIEFPLAKSHYLMMPVRNQRPRPEVLILRDWLLDLDWDAP